MISDTSSISGYFHRINHPFTVYFYAPSDPRDGRIRYVGKTISIRKRKVDHNYAKGPSRRAKWIRSLKKQGLYPAIEIIEELHTCDDDNWQEVERFWISYIRFLGFDLTNGDSGGNAGKRLSQETISRRTEHRTYWLSEESRAKVSAAMKGRKVSKRSIEKRLRTQREKELSRTPEQRKEAADKRAETSKKSRETWRKTVEKMKQSGVIINAKYTVFQAEELRIRYTGKYGEGRRLAKEFGIGYSSVMRILNGRKTQEEMAKAHQPAQQP